MKAPQDAEIFNLMFSVRLPALWSIILELYFETGIQPSSKAKSAAQRYVYLNIRTEPRLLI